MNLPQYIDGGITEKARVTDISNCTQPVSSVRLSATVAELFCEHIYSGGPLRIGLDALVDIIASVDYG